MSYVPGARSRDQCPSETSEDAALAREAQKATSATETAATEDIGGAHHNPLSKSDIRTDMQSIERRYPTSPEQRQLLINRMVRALREGNDSIATRAAAVLIAAERADNARMQAPAPGQAGKPQINISVQVAAREAAVFGDVDAFRRAAQHQIADASKSGVSPDTPESLPETPQNGNSGAASAAVDANQQYE